MKWGGIELGRTKSSPDAREPNWQEERFRLALSANDVNDKGKRLPLVMEVWGEDVLGAQGDFFLGQVMEYRKLSGTLSVSSDPHSHESMSIPLLATSLLTINRHSS